MIKKSIDISSWNFTKKEKKPTILKKKCPEVKKLNCYKKTPHKDFWASFPKNNDTEFFQTPVNCKKLVKIIESCKSKWSIHQKRIADLTIKNLTWGTKSKFKGNVEFLKSKNTSSALFFGEMMTDTIAYWVKKGFVLGPFDNPPYKKMCLSPLMASKHKNKIRPILNLSAPEGNSVNDMMEDYKFRKLTMSSAKNFGQTLLMAGVDAKFAKTDIQDAYKLLPCAKEERRFFGFEWLNKTFMDISTPFGSKAAPANFDDLGETLVNIAKTKSNTEDKWVHRQLDDVPVVSPKNSNISENFTKCYKELCKEFNVPLAENCVNFEKAFECTTVGTDLPV